MPPRRSGMHNHEMIAKINYLEVLCVDELQRAAEFPQTRQHHELPPGGPEDGVHRLLLKLLEFGGRLALVHLEKGDVNGRVFPTDDGKLVVDRLPLKGLQWEKKNEKKKRKKKKNEKKKKWKKKKKKKKKNEKIK